MMARIPLTSGFTLIPEGEHLFTITEVEYKEDFGKMLIKMQNEKGVKHTERYSLKTKDGDYNEGALNAFSYMAKVAMNDMDLEEIDEQKLVGRKFYGVIEHSTQESKTKAGTMITFANITDKSPYEGDYEESAPKKKVDLASLLG